MTRYARAVLARIALVCWTSYYLVTALRLALGVRPTLRKSALRALRTLV